MVRYQRTERDREGDIYIYQTKIHARRFGAVGSIVIYSSVEARYKERSISCLKYFFAYFANRPTYHTVQ